MFKWDLTEMVSTITIAEALESAVTETGTTLAALSGEAPLLLVFLRQFG